MMPIALMAQGVVVARAQRRIIDGARLCVVPGEIVAIEGSSGAGKSTLLLALAGLLRPDQGRVLVAGHDLSGLSHEERAQRVAIATQSPVFPPDLTVSELVRLGRFPHEVPAHGFMRRLWRRDANPETPVEQAMAAVGMRGLAARKLGSLSGGEQRRAHVARVLAQETPLLLLDEPTTHLDEVTARQLFNELQRRALQGTAILLATHDVVLAHRCDRRLRLINGRLFSAPQRHNQSGIGAKLSDDSVRQKIASIDGLDR